MNSRELLKQLYIGIGMSVAFFAAIGAIFMRPIWLYESSLIIGGGLACFLLYYTYDCLERALDMQPKSARAFITIRVLFRLAFRAGLLVVSIIIDWSAFVGVSIGLLSVKISAYMNPLVKRHRIKAGIIQAEPLAQAMPADGQSKPHDPEGLHDPADGQTKPQDLGGLHDPADDPWDEPREIERDF